MQISIADGVNTTEHRPAGKVIWYKLVRL